MIIDRVGGCAIGPTGRKEQHEEAADERRFLAGVQLVFLGVLGEYIGRIYEEVKRRPHYVVGELIRRS